MKVLLLLIFSTGLGTSYDTVPVTSVEACKATAAVIKNYNKQKDYIIDWGKSSSYMCIDAQTGEELIPRTYKFEK